MGWSIKLGRIAGIPVQMHLTFLLLLAWVGWSHWQRDGTSQAVITGVAFILALFGCVLLHELGHALTARKYGIKTKDITLLPIGGVARLEKMPDDPRQELWVALAGPAVNVVIAALLFGWLQISGGWQPVEQLGVARGSFVERLMIVNLFLIGFNLLPAFPMDGGRVLRALLAMRMEYSRATQAAANIGQMMAVLFGVAGLFGNPFLLLIAFFVWIGAAQEASAVQVKSVMGEVPVERAMQTNYKVLSPADTLARVTELLLEGAQQDFPVVWGSEVIGILTRADLMPALAQRDPQTPVSEVMRRDFCTANADEMLEPVFARLGAEQCRTMPVLRDGRLAGLLTMENVGEWVMVQSALRTKQDSQQNRAEND
jgi:Zn-dependent protease/CBS domain-containing protein